MRFSGGFHTNDVPSFNGACRDVGTAPDSQRSTIPRRRLLTGKNDSTIPTMTSSPSETSTSLIRRLGKHEPRAWEDFATKYTWMMRRWLRSWNIPLDDVDDILQDTCLRVFRSVHKFQHRGQGSFRGWLKKVSRSCWLDVIRKTAYRARLQCKLVDLNQFLSEETLSAMDNQIDLLIEQELFDCALARTRQISTDLAWNAYRLTVLDGQSGAKTAERLGVSINCVYKNKERFEIGLNETLQTLRGTD